jgi:hypothetical protein
VCHPDNCQDLQRGPVGFDTNGHKDGYVVGEDEPIGPGPWDKGFDELRAVLSDKEKIREQFVAAASDIAKAEENDACKEILGCGRLQHDGSTRVPS